jgi:hypothetical protein
VLASLLNKETRVKSQFRCAPLSALNEVIDYAIFQSPVAANQKHHQRVCPTPVIKTFSGMGETIENRPQPFQVSIIPSLTQKSPKPM